MAGLELDLTFSEVGFTRTPPLRKCWVKRLYLKQIESAISLNSGPTKSLSSSKEKTFARLGVKSPLERRFCNFGQSKLLRSIMPAWLNSVKKYCRPERTVFGESFGELAHC